MKKYKVIRFYFDNSHPDHKKIIKSNLTKAEAQAHCGREDTHKGGVWFDGWDDED